MKGEKEIEFGICGKGYVIHIFRNKKSLCNSYSYNAIHSKYVLTEKNVHNLCATCKKIFEGKNNFYKNKIKVELQKQREEIIQFFRDYADIDDNEWEELCKPKLDDYLKGEKAE